MTWRSALHRKNGERAIYRVTYSLHDGRAAHVTGDRIVATVSTWLAELGVESPMVEELAEAVNRGDWPVAHRIADILSVEITAGV